MLASSQQIELNEDLNCQRPWELKILTNHKYSYKEIKKQSQSEFNVCGKAIMEGPQLLFLGDVALQGILKRSCFLMLGEADAVFAGLTLKGFV
jgi:hypothetical protein